MAVDINKPCALQYMGNCGPDGSLLHKISYPKSTLISTVCDNHLNEFTKNGWVEEPQSPKNQYFPDTSQCPCSTSGSYGPHGGILLETTGTTWNGKPLFVCEHHLPFYQKLGYHALKDISLGDMVQPTDLLADSPVPTKYKSAWGYVPTKPKTVAQIIEEQQAKWNTNLAPIDAPIESDEEDVEEGVVPAYKKFESAHGHSSARKLDYYCAYEGKKGNDGSTMHWGNVYNKDNHYFVCSNHYDGKGYITVHKPPMKAKVVSAGDYNKYKSAIAHKKAEHLMCYCTDSGKGADGTYMHWGCTYQTDMGAYVCKNHLKDSPWTYEYQPNKINAVEPPSGLFPKEKCAGCNSRKKLTHQMKRKGNPKIVGATIHKICSTCYETYKVQSMWVCRPIDGTFAANHRTQKAQGVEALMQEGFPVPSYDVYPADKEIAEDVLLGKFVRPCPMRPRHGFVESRVVKTAKQIATLREETLAADPEAEFIVMPFIKAEYSGIWTDGSLAIGEGHSGATEGTSAITLPVLGDFLSTVGGNSYKLKKAAGIKSAPYVELLWKTIGKGTRETYAHETVQLRDGPALPQGATDYIPAEMEVKEVLVAKGDLLRWEELMKATVAGAVVYHPNGSLASHYAIHAVLNNIPVMITREPRVGDRLIPTGETVNPVDVKAIRDGFTYALSSSMGFKDATYYMLAGLHHVVTWKGKYDRLLGAAMGCAFRLALIASAGECRHLGGAKAGRESVYSAKWKKTDGAEGRKVYAECLDKFLNHHWSSGYGGVAWYSFAVLGAQMYNAIVDGEIDKAFTHFNNLVHSAHNGGWAFNKFMDTNEMTLAADYPVYAAVHAAPFIYDASKMLGLLGQKELFAADYAWDKILTLEDTDKGKRAKRNIVDAHGHVVEKGAKKMCDNCGLYLHDCTCNEEDHDHECPIKEADPDLGLPAPPKEKMPVKDAQAYLRPHKGAYETVHVQYKTDWYIAHGIKSGHDGPYGKKDLHTEKPYVDKPVDKVAFKAGLKLAEKSTSWAGSDTVYGKLTKKDDGWYMGDVKLLELEEK